MQTSLKPATFAPVLLDPPLRTSPLGHPDSITHQTVFDLNEVIDREYKYIFSTDDNGWLVGGKS